MIELFPSRAIALTVGPLAVHWYGLMYLLAFAIGALLLPKVQRYRHLAMDQKTRESLFVHVFLGVLLGGRLGYVLFYGFEYYLNHPVEIIAVWKGGMASHGGMIGVALALCIFSRRQKVPLLALMDVLVPLAAIGLMLGRLGNFINQELYGTVTTLPWGMHFPGAEGLRHPTQLYAMAKDLLIALATFAHLAYTHHRRSGRSVGRTAALFCMMYGVLRFVVEFFRDQPQGFVSIIGLSLSRGQLLTIPLFVVGVCLWFYPRGNQHRH